MIDENLLLCEKEKEAKCISEELYRIKKYYRYFLYVIGVFDEEDNSIIVSQLIIVIIKLLLYYKIYFFAEKALINYLYYELIDYLHVRFRLGRSRANLLTFILPKCAKFAQILLKVYANMLSVFLVWFFIEKMFILIFELNKIKLI
jgi:hypothetical protein